jgi:signal transduction histidine kinase
MDDKELRERLGALERRVQAETQRRVEAEARLRQAQKMEAVGQLTSGIAHDFNNLLQVIMGNLELIKRRHEPFYQTVEAALQATRAATQLTQRLLAFSRLQPLEPRALEVNRLIVGLSDRMARALGETIRVETGLDAGLWPVHADRNQLETALLNLVVNARDAMGEGGRLAIRTRNLALPAPLDDAPAGDYVLLEVSDTGCGIPEEHLPKVFEPFFTTTESGKGSGLGLAMVYGFVRQCGGHVRLHSRVGKGTSVRLYLPRCGAAPSVARARHGETILLVEDNAEVRRYGTAALAELGYRVLEAPDGSAALRLLDTPAAPRVDLLFSDRVLPGGMSGRVLAEAVRERRPGVRVLFGKPYDLERLAASVREAIDSGKC